MRIVPSRLLVSTFFDRPLIVAGTGRSGTGVLKRSLGVHSQILACDGESPLVAQAASLAAPFHLTQNREYQTVALKIPLEELHDRLKSLCFDAAMGKRYGTRRTLREIVRARKSPRGLKYWCAKTFPDCHQAQALLMLYPSARFLYIFRNGCEVVRSRMRFSSMRHRSFREHCEAWSDGVERYEYLRTLQSARPIRHEDFVSGPDAVLSSLWPFLDLSPEPGPATFASTTLVHPLDEPTQTSVDVQRKLRERQDAHTEWTKVQKETFKSICSVGMEKLGYEMTF